MFGVGTVECLTDQLPQTLAGAPGGLAQRRLAFAEGLLDGVEVWAIGRQVNELSAGRRDRLGNAGGLVACQIVEHDNVVRPQARR